jgi:hypothetical protein
MKIKSQSSGIAQKHRDATGSPGGYSAPKEIRVFCPDWAANCQC